MSDTPSNAEMIDSNHMRIDGKIYRVVDPDILAYITKLERENAALREQAEKMGKVVQAAKGIRLNDDYGVIWETWEPFTKALRECEESK